MTRIQDLMRQLAPKGVAFKPLAEVATIRTGVRPSDEQLAKGGAVPYLNGGVSPSGRVAESNTEAGSIAIPSRGSVGVVGYSGVPSWCGPLCYRVRSNKEERLLTRFLFFALKSIEPSIVRLQQTGSIPALNKKDLAGVRVPVPPIDIQREVVKILDCFSQLEVELVAELDARRVQLSRYRAQLLNSQEADFRPLGEIAKFKYGYTMKAAQSGPYRFLRITDITDEGKLSSTGAKFVDATPAALEFLVQPGDLLMARTGATFGKTMLCLEGDPAVYASYLIRIRFTSQRILPAYYWHFAQSDLYWSQANAMVSTGGQPQFNANVLQRVKMPMPPIEEQRRVVGILDKFDALANDINVGLPAELAARRKQYEYYRDKLLTFEEAPA